MAPTTSDIQHVLSKTQAVEQMYQTQKQQPDTDQQKFAATVQQKIYDKAHQTQESAETDQAKIRKDREDKLTLSSRGRRGKKKKHNAARKEEDDENTAFDDDVGQIVDIKI